MRLGTKAGGVILLTLVAMAAWVGLELVVHDGYHMVHFDVDPSGNIATSYRGAVKINGAMTSDLADRLAWVDGTKGYLLVNRGRIWKRAPNDPSPIQVTFPEAGESDVAVAWEKRTATVVFIRAAGSSIGGLGLRPSKLDLFCCSIDGSGLRQLTFRRYFEADISPQSSADGYLYFAGHESPLDGDSPIWRVSISTRKLDRMQVSVPDGVSLRFTSVPSIARDGRHLVLVGNRGNDQVILVGPTTNLSLVAAYSTSGYIQGPVLFDQGGRNIIFEEDIAREERPLLKQVNIL